MAITVRELLTKLGFKVDQSSVNRVERATDRVKDRAEKAAESFRNIAVALGGLAAIKSIVTIADNMQSLRARIEMLPQTIGDAGAAFDELAAHASATRMDIEAYGSLYTRVGNAAKDYITTQEDLLRITDTIGNALVVGGTKGQEAAAVMTQFSQALASGVLQGDEFRSMAEAAPQYLDKLSETMKIPRDQLKKMASDGKLTSRAVIDATREMSDYFEDRMRKMPLTVSDATTIIGNRWSRMIDRMNRQSGTITKIANRMIDAMDWIEAKFDDLIDKVGGVENALNILGNALIITAGAIAVAFAPAVLEFAAITAAIIAAALVLEDFMTWINGGDSLIGSMIGPWEEWRDTVMKAVDMVMGVLRPLWDFMVGLAQFFVALWQGNGDEAVAALGRIWDAFSRLADGIFTLLVNAIALAFIAIYKTAKAQWDAIGRILKNGWDLAWNHGFDGFVALLGKLGTELKNWATSSLVRGALKLTPMGSLALGAYDKLVTPNKMTSAGIGKGGGTTVNDNRQIHVQAAPGTTKEQIAQVKRDLAKGWGKAGGDSPMARDAAARGR